MQLKVFIALFAVSALAVSCAEGLKCYQCTYVEDSGDDKCKDVKDSDLEAQEVVPPTTPTAPTTTKPTEPATTNTETVTSGPTEASTADSSDADTGSTAANTGSTAANTGSTAANTESTAAATESTDAATESTDDPTESTDSTSPPAPRENVFETRIEDSFGAARFQRLRRSVEPRVQEWNCVTITGTLKVNDTDKEFIHRWAYLIENGENSTKIEQIRNSMKAACTADLKEICGQVTNSTLRSQLDELTDVNLTTCNEDGCNSSSALGTSLVLLAIALCVTYFNRV